MGRKRNPDSRRSKAAARRAQKAAAAAARLAERGSPNIRVAERRETFPFAGDQDTCDAIGRLHILGYLHGHGHEPKDLRDIGREYAELYWERYDATAPAVGSLEPRSRSTGGPPPRNARYERFDRLDASLSRSSLERLALTMLLTDHYYTDDITGWAQRLVDRALARKEGRAEPHQGCLGHDQHMLQAAVRGLCQLLDAGLPMRRAA